MTVRELIEELSKQDQGLDVWTASQATAHSYRLVRVDLEKYALGNAVSLVFYDLGD